MGKWFSTCVNINCSDYLQDGAHGYTPLNTMMDMIM